MEIAFRIFCSVVRWRRDTDRQRVISRLGIPPLRPEGRRRLPGGPPPSKEAIGKGRLQEVFRRFPWVSRWVAFLVVLALVWVDAPVRAATLYWDTNGSATGSANLTTGTWGTSSFWNTDPTGGGNGAFQILTTALDDAVFSAGSNATGANALTISGAEVIRSLTFNNGTVTLSGTSSPALTIGTGGITMAGGLNGNLTILNTLTNIILAGSQAWTNYSAKALNIISSSGVVVISGTASSGVTDILTLGGPSLATYWALAGSFQNGLNGGSLALTKIGPSGVTLQKQNTYTGPTTVSEGALTLSFSLLGANASNIISASSALVLGDSSLLTGQWKNPTLVVSGSAGQGNAQSFASTTIYPAQNAQITVGTSAAGTVTINLGTITVGSYASLNLSVPAGGTITAANPNNSTGIIGTWLTIGTATASPGLTQGPNFAMNDGTGRLVPYNGSTLQVGTAIATSGNHLYITGSTTGSLTTSAGMTDWNTIRVNDTVSRTLSLGGTLRLGADGAIFWADSTLTNGLTMTGGSLTAGGAPNAPGQISLIAYSSRTDSAIVGMTVNSKIIDNGTGAVSVLKTGQQTQVSLGGNNTYSGGTTITAGVLNVNSGSALGVGPVNVLPGAGLAIGANVLVTNNITISGIGDAYGNYTSRGALSFPNVNGPYALGTAASLLTLVNTARIRIYAGYTPVNYFNEIRSKITGSGTLEVSGGFSTYAPVLVISNPLNDWAGDLRINHSVLSGAPVVFSSSAATAGLTVQLGSSGVIPDSANVIIGGRSINGYNSIFALNGFSETIAGLSDVGTPAQVFVMNGTSAAGVATLKVGSFNATSSFGGSITDGGTGALALTKIGAGTLSLTGSNSYTGTTSIHGGVLYLGGSGNELNGGGTLTFGGGTLRFGVAGASYINPIKNSTSTVLLDSNGVDVLLSGSIGASNTAGFTKFGAATVSLIGSSGYTGATNILAGGMNVTGSNAFSGGGDVVIAAGAGLNYGARQDAPLSIAGSLTITSGAGTYLGASIGAGASSAAINVGGAATLTAGSLRIDISGVSGVTPVSGIYTLLHGGAGSALDLGSVFFGNAYNVTTFRLGGITRTATDLMVEVIAGGSSPASLAWRGGYSGATNAWSVSNAVDASNWTVGGTAQAGVPGVNTTVTFSDSTLLTAPTATVLGADVSVNGLVMSDTVNGLGVLADGHVLSVGTGGISLLAGTQAVTIAPNIILSGSQTWQNDSGNILSVSGDVAALGNQLSVGGAGAVTISGNFSTTGGLVKSGAGVFTLSGIHSVAGDTLINGGTIHYQTGWAQVYPSVISGSGSVMKSGAATLTLSGSNSYSGFTYINAGAILSANTSAFGSSTLTFGGGQWLVGGTGGTYSNTIANSGSSAVILDTNGYTVNLAGDIEATNTGGLTKTGLLTGTLILSGNNSYTGDTTWTYGTLKLSNLKALGGGGNVAPKGTVNLQMGVEGGVFNNDVTIASSPTVLKIDTSGFDTVWSGNLSGAFSSINYGYMKSGTGVLTLAGRNSMSIGSFFVTAGTLRLGSTLALGAATLRFQGGLLQFGVEGANYSNSVANSGGNAIKIDTNGYNGILSGSLDATNTGGLTKAGLGVLTLAGSNTYTGTTTISAGGIVAANANAFAGGSLITVASGAGLDYGATADAPLLIGGSLLVTAGSGSYLGGAIGAGTSSAAVTVAGAAQISGGSLSINVYGITGAFALVGTNTYTLIHGGSGSTLNAGTVTLGNLYNATNFTVGANPFSARTATDLTVTIIGVPALTSAYWKGGYSGGATVWSASDGATVSNWSPTAGGTGQSLVPGTTTMVYFPGGTMSNSPVGATLGANMSILGLSVTDGAYGMSLVGDTKTLTIGGSGIVVASGVPLASIGANVALGAAQSWTNNSAANLVVSGVLSGSGALVLSGSRTVELSGANTYTSNVALNSGTLKLSGVSALPASGALSFGGGTLVFGTSGGNYGSTIANSGTFTILVNTSGFDGVLSGTIQASNSGGLMKSGQGTLTLSGANAYTGTTTLAAGTLKLASLSAIGTGSLTFAGGSLQLGVNSATYTHKITGSGSSAMWFDSNTFASTFSGVIDSTNTGVLIKTGSGTVALRGVNTYAGGTSIRAGTLGVATSASAIGTGSLEFAGGTLQFGNTLTIANSITTASGA